MTDKLYQAYYQPDKHTIIKWWLAKQTIWQVHVPPPKEINHPHYDATKPNEQHQFDILYIL